MESLSLALYMWCLNDHNGIPVALPNALTPPWTHKGAQEMNILPRTITHLQLCQLWHPGSGLHQCPGEGGGGPVHSTHDVSSLFCPPIISVRSKCIFMTTNLSFTDDQQFVTFMCGSIACWLEKDGFMDQLIQLRQSLTDDKQFDTLMCNSITCRLEKEGFTDKLIQLRRSFTNNKQFARCESSSA